MVRKNKQEYGTISLKKDTIKKLKTYKIHKTESMEDVIKREILKNEK